MSDERVTVVRYQESWPAQFEAERELLERVLAPWLKAGVHHVGATSVQGLAAKPVIDMLTGVAQPGGGARGELVMGERRMVAFGRTCSFSCA